MYIFIIYFINLIFIREINQNIKKFPEKIIYFNYLKKSKKNLQKINEIKKFK